MCILKPTSVADASALSALWRHTFIEAYENVHSPENIDAYCRDNFSEADAQAVLCDPKVNAVIATKDDALYLRFAAGQPEPRWFDQRFAVT